MQARSKPSTATHFIQGDNVIDVTNHLFLRGQPNMKMRDQKHGPFEMEEQIGKTQLQIEPSTDSTLTLSVSC
jgi:hypothetical protein